MKQEYKPYLIAGLSFMLSVYLLAFLFLALLTTINSAAGYPLYNFLGSEVNLEPVVLQLLPAQNPYHLQNWSALPVMTLLFSLVAFLIALLVLWNFLKQILVQGKFRLVGFLLFIGLLAGLTFNNAYTAIAGFITALVQA